jgi:hypothetical protein
VRGGWVEDGRRGGDTGRRAVTTAGQPTMPLLEGAARSDLCCRSLRASHPCFLFDRRNVSSASCLLPLGRAHRADPRASLLELRARGPLVEFDGSSAPTKWALRLISEQPSCSAALQGGIEGRGRAWALWSLWRDPRRASRAWRASRGGSGRRGRRQKSLRRPPRQPAQPAQLSRGTGSSITTLFLSSTSDDDRQPLPISRATWSSSPPCGQLIRPARGRPRRLRPPPRPPPQGAAAALLLWNGSSSGRPRSTRASGTRPVRCSTSSSTPASPTSTTRPRRASAYRAGP